MTDSLNSLEEENSEERTNAWVMGEPADNECQETTSEGPSELDQPIQNAPESDCEEMSLDGVDQSLHSENDNPDRDCDIVSLAAEPDSDFPHMSDVLPVDTDFQSHSADTDVDQETKLLPTDPVQTADTQVPLVDVVHDTGAQANSSAPTEHVVRTRVGRVSRQVNRLIESMVQKPFHFRDMASSISKRSQSLLTLF